MAEPVRRSRRFDATAEQATAERPATNAATEATTPEATPEQDQPADTAEAAEVALGASVYGESISQCK